MATWKEQCKDYLPGEVITYSSKNKKNILDCKKSYSHRVGNSNKAYTPEEKYFVDRIIDESCELSHKEVEQMARFLYLYESNGFCSIAQTIKFISREGLWTKFDAIHSINTYESGFTDDGIFHKYYSIVSSALCIDIGNGSALVRELAEN